VKLSVYAHEMSDYVQNLQLRIVNALEKIDGQSKFETIDWQRPGGGGGRTKVLKNGGIFEKAGVNVSRVEGDLPTSLMQRLGTTESKFFATGLSLVLHPRSPQVPTVHANYRYFEQANKSWFGGGADLTPYCVSESDFQHFHQVLKKACDVLSADAYSMFKAECDKYFWIEHRGEARGVGGIFFDYMQDNHVKSFSFVKAAGDSFVESYLPIVERNKDKKFSERQKKFQLLRRGRYVEFNLVYDRGTLFGLQTKGNIESILMSLPAEVNFDFMASMEETEEEKLLTSWFKNPRSWI